MTGLTVKSATQNLPAESFRYCGKTIDPNDAFEQLRTFF